MSVLALPPSESDITMVSRFSRYGTKSAPDDSAEITLPSADNDLLIDCPSFSVAGGRSFQAWNEFGSSSRVTPKQLAFCRDVAEKVPTGILWESFTTRLGDSVKALQKERQSKSEQPRAAERLLNTISTELQVLLTKSATDMRQIFGKMDSDGSGALSSKEFSRGLHELGVSLTAEDVQRIMHELDSSGDGQVDYDDFITTFRDTPKKKAATKLLAGVTTELQRLLKAENTTLKQVFEEFDANHDGQISCVEFRTGLRALSKKGKAFDFTVKAYQIEELIQLLDADGNGSIDYSEFVAWFSPKAAPKATAAPAARSAPAAKAKPAKSRDGVPAPMARPKRTDAQRTARTINRVLREQHVRLVDVVGLFDSVGKGALSASEFQQFISRFSRPGDSAVDGRAVFDVVHAMVEGKAAKYGTVSLATISKWLAS